MATTRLYIALPTGEQLAFWKVAQESGTEKQHIFMTHGTFSSKKVCLVLAEYLAEHGYCCWILEWRNHGDSFKTTAAYNFETIAKEEIKHSLDYLIKEQGVQQLDVITHSGGGLCFTIALLAYPSYQNYIRSLTLFACQATHAASTLPKRWRLKASKALCKVLGYIPAKIVGGEYNEPYTFMEQWFDWNLTTKFEGRGQEAYSKLMATITIPVLAIFGKGDTFIAPAKGCQAFLEFFQNPLNKALLASKENGFLEDYTHSRIIHSRAAHQEIYPKVLAWIMSRSEPENH